MPDANAAAPQSGAETTSRVGLRPWLSSESGVTDQCPKAVRATHGSSFTEVQAEPELRMSSCSRLTPLNQLMLWLVTSTRKSALETASTTARIVPPRGDAACWERPPLRR